MSLAVSLFELATELAQRHDRAGNDRINVIPVVVDDLTTALPVLAALCRVLEGRLFAAADTDLQAAVPGTQDAARRAAITEALTSLPDAPRHVDLVSGPEGTLDVVFADPSAGLASPGEQEVLAIARAIGHRDLDAHSFAVLAYRESLIDLPFRRAVWTLVVKRLHGMPHSTLRTLVVVAEGAIDVGLHCQTGVGFQLAVEGQRLLRRNGVDDLNYVAGYIARQPHPIILFLGAGFAVSSKLPLALPMRDSAIRRLLSVPPADPVSSDALATRYHQFMSDKKWLTAREQQMSQTEFVRRLTLEQVIRAQHKAHTTVSTLQEFKELHDESVKTPGLAMRELAKILSIAAGRVVLVEVNFDLLIETHAKVPLRVFSTDAGFADAPDYLQRYFAGQVKDIPVLKLHGTIANFDSCVISADQTELGIGTEKLATLRVLLDEAHPRLWIYVGASMRDLDLLPVFAGQDFGRGTNERWVLPYLVDSVEEFGNHRESTWLKYDPSFSTVQSRLIAETADSFFSALSAQWSAAWSDGASDSAS